jgi:regulator of replication initiation timing
LIQGAGAAAVQLDHDLMELWLEGLLLPDDARPLIEEVQALRHQLSDMRERLREAEAEVAGALVENLDLERRLGEATAFATRLDAERTLHLRRLLGVGAEHALA